MVLGEPCGVGLRTSERVSAPSHALRQAPFPPPPLQTKSLLLSSTSKSLPHFFHLPQIQNQGLGTLLHVAFLFSLLQTWAPLSSPVPQSFSPVTP